MTLLRYIDLVLLWLSVPLLLAAGAPAFGVLLAAAAWTIQRVVMVAVDRRAQSRADVRDAIGLNMAAMLGRMWLLASTILVAGLAGEREDGVAAAVVLLAVFTLSFANTQLVRTLTRKPNHT